MFINLELFTAGLIKTTIYLFSYLPNSALSLKSEKLEKFSWLMTEFRRYKVNGLKIEFHIVKALNQKKFGHIIKIRLCMAHS
jgi:hypothetical protein